LGGRKRLRLWLQIELRQNRLERREAGGQWIAICINRGSQKSAERVALGVGKFKRMTASLTFS